MNKKILNTSSREPLMIVGADLGFKNCKIVYGKNGKIEKISFPSAIEEGENEDGRYTVHIDEKPFNIRTANKLTDTTHKIKDNALTRANLFRSLFEVSKETGFEVKDFVVGIGCSMDTYRDEEAREEFKNNILNNNVATVRAYWTNEDGEPVPTEVTLRIIDVTIHPEMVCAVYNVVDFDPQEANLLVDIGGLNRQIVMYEGVPALKTAFCNEDGFDALVDQVTGAMKAHKLTTTRESVERYINNIEEQSKKNASIKQRTDFIEDFLVNKYFGEDIKKDMKKVAVDLDLYNLIFVGGTAARLEKYISQVFEGAKFPKNPFFATAIGIYQRTRFTYQDKLAQQKAEKNC